MRHVHDDGSADCDMSFCRHVLPVVLFFSLLFVYGPSDIYKGSFWQLCEVSPAFVSHTYHFIFLHSWCNMISQSSPNPTLQFGEHTLTLTSWKVKGLNQPVKRSKVLHHLQGMETIVFLQETHLKSGNHSLLHKQWVGQMYHSHYSCKARGTAILINKSVPFTLSNTNLDKNGRYIIVTGKIYSTPVTLADLYAPNWDDEDFFSSPFCFLSKICSLTASFGKWL